MDALPKEYLPPISANLLFRGIFAIRISHGSSIATQHRKIYSNIWNMTSEVTQRSHFYQNRQAFVFSSKQHNLRLWSRYRQAHRRKKKHSAMCKNHFFTIKNRDSSYLLYKIIDFPCTYNFFTILNIK
jgi:hypothetical protein